MKRFLSVVLVSVFVVGCSTINLTRREKDVLYELKQYGIFEPEEIYKDPDVAMALSFLPGCGNVYLAVGETGRTYQWALAALNFITWPISIFWSIPQTSADADLINKREMVYYFRLHPEGKHRLKMYRNQAEDEVLKGKGVRGRRFTEERYADVEDSEE